MDKSCSKHDISHAQADFSPCSQVKQFCSPGWWACRVLSVNKQPDQRASGRLLTIDEGQSTKTDLGLLGLYDGQYQ